MAEQIHPKSCLKCFYNELDPNIHPCVDCFEGSKWVDRNIYIHNDASKPLSEAIKEWVDVRDAQVPIDYDLVNKPKHYMLFEDEGIEVRDVIAKLVTKLYAHSGSIFEDKDNPLFESDYVQLMQYLMRFMEKNGVEDLKKARVYLNWMIEAYENNDEKHNI